MIQSCGKEPIAAQEFDALSIAAHKFYGPKGVGALILRAAQPIQPIALGGSHENQRRAGTENVAGIVGMAAAAAWSHAEMSAEHARQGELRDRLWQGIQALAPNAICNGFEAPRLANTLNVTFPGIDAQSMLMNLDLAGICASSGSACMVGSIEPSHVLLAMGVPADLARCSIRFSLGKFTTEQEIERVLTVLPAILERLHPEPA
jgi:cysteine desulfurase